MSKEKNKNTFRVAALLLVACLISSVMLSGTFAKYTSEYAGKDTALVARWSFTGNFDSQQLNGTNIDLPIWDHNYSTNIYQRVGSEEDGWEYLIAPGIQGEFTVDFTYDADVDAELVFNFAKSGDAANKVPIQYSLDNFAPGSTIYYDLDKLEDAIIATATNSSGSAANISGTGGTYIITDTSTSGPVAINQNVYWRWPYNVNLHTGDYSTWTDADDTQIGKDSLPDRDDYVLQLDISATQRVPANFAMAAINASTPQIGETISAGDLTPDTATVSYEWQVSNVSGIGYTPIDGAADSDEYEINGDNVAVGRYIRVVATGTGDYAGTVTSAPVGPIAAAD
jgi:hypothetical protein